MARVLQVWRKRMGLPEWLTRALLEQFSQPEHLLPAGLPQPAVWLGPGPKPLAPLPRARAQSELASCVPL